MEDSFYLIFACNGLVCKGALDVLWWNLMIIITIIDLSTETVISRIGKKCVRIILSIISQRKSLQSIVSTVRVNCVNPELIS